MTTTIAAWGNSLGLRIPKQIAQKASINIGDPVEISLKGDTIILKKKKIRRSVDEIIGSYKGQYDFEWVDWGEPEGDEIW